MVDEQLSISKVITDQNDQPVFDVYSTTGKKQTNAAFNKAAEVYSKTGKAPKGFSFLKSGSMQSKFRSMFESVNQTVQGEAQSADKAFLALVNKVGGMIAPSKPPLESKPEGQQFGVNPFRLLTSTVDTPEKAGATAALMGAAALTGGASGVYPALGRISAAMGGAGAASVATDKKRSVENLETMLIVGMGAAFGEGFTGIVGKLLKRSLSQRANEQVGKDIVDLIKTRYPDVANQGKDAIDAIASTEKGLNDLIRIGVKALKQDADDMAIGLVSNLQQVAPRSMTTAGRKETMALANKLVSASDDFLEAISSAKPEQKAVDSAVNAMKQVSEDIVAEFKKQFSNASPTSISNVVKAVQNFEKQIKSFVSGADVISSLRASGGVNGFSVQAFQQHMSKKHGDALFEAVGYAAGRGKRGGIDTIRQHIDFPLTPEFSFGKRGPSGLKLRLPKSAGAKYVGTVRGTVEGIRPAADVVSIREFLKED